MNDHTKISQSVLIVDDHILFREALANLINSTHDFRVVAQVGTVRDGVAKALHFEPDIVLMDFLLPDGSGLDATRKILDKFPECKIIFMTVRERDENLMDAVRVGAKGYLLKNVSSSSFLASLRAFTDGEIASLQKPTISGMHLERN